MKTENTIDLKQVEDFWNSNLFGKQFIDAKFTSKEHHCTDGPDCYIANIYYQNEIQAMLEKSGFKVEKMKKGRFPIGVKFPKLERFFAKHIGFHQLVWAKKH